VLEQVKRCVCTVEEREILHQFLHLLSLCAPPKVQQKLVETVTISQVAFSYPLAPSTVLLDPSSSFRGFLRHSSLLAALQLRHRPPSTCRPYVDEQNTAFDPPSMLSSTQNDGMPSPAFSHHDFDYSLRYFETHGAQSDGAPQLSLLPLSSASLLTPTNAHKMSDTTRLPSLDDKTASFDKEEKAAELALAEGTGLGGNATNAENLNRSLTARQVSLIAMFVSFPLFFSCFRGGINRRYCS
jgi:hypothetical protein